MFVGSPALSRAGSVLLPVKYTLGSHGTQSSNGRKEAGGCFEDYFKELVLLGVPVREQGGESGAGSGPALGAACPQSRAEQRPTCDCGPRGMLVPQCS